MRRKRISALCLLLSVLFVISGLALAKEKDYVQGVTETELQIGCFNAMTGPAAYIGVAAVQSAELYFNKVNAQGGVHGRKIKLIVEDTACQPIKGVAAVKKLLSLKPFMLFGSSCSGVALAVLQSVIREGIPCLVPGATTAKIFVPVRKNIFRMGAFPDNVQSKAVVDFDIHELHARRIAIINDASEYGQGGSEGIIKRLAEYGLEPVAREEVNVGDTDFSTQILKVKTSNPEVVHVYSYPKEAAILARQAKELGLTAQLIFSGAVTTPSFLESAGKAAIGSLNIHYSPYLIDSPEPLITDFVKELKANYRIGAGRPSSLDLIGIAAGMVIVEALQRAGKDLTWEKFIHALESLENFETGYAQPVSFSPTDHNGTKSGKLLVVLPNKKWKVLAVDLGVREKVEPLGE